LVLEDWFPANDLRLLLFPLTEESLPESQGARPEGKYVKVMVFDADCRRKKQIFNLM